MEAAWRSGSSSGKAIACIALMATSVSNLRSSYTVFDRIFVRSYSCSSRRATTSLYRAGLTFLATRRTDVWGMARRTLVFSQQARIRIRKVTDGGNRHGKYHNRRFRQRHAQTQGPARAQAKGQRARDRPGDAGQARSRPRADLAPAQGPSGHPRV